MLASRKSRRYPVLCRSDYSSIFHLRSFSNPAACARAQGEGARLQITRSLRRLRDFQSFNYSVREPPSLSPFARSTPSSPRPHLLLLGVALASTFVALPLRHVPVFPTYYFNSAKEFRSLT